MYWMWLGAKSGLLLLIVHMNSKTTPTLAWHYTLGVHLLRILEQGCILPFDTPETPVVESPIAWFSMNQRHELSALKSLDVAGVAHPATLQAMRQFGNGVYRLGIAPQALLDGAALRRKACRKRILPDIGMLAPVGPPFCAGSRRHPSTTTRVLRPVAATLRTLGIRCAVVPYRARRVAT